MLSAPSDFAKKYISNKADDRLFASIRFFAAMFSASFAMVLLISRFQFYEGSSEIRAFGYLLIEVTVGTTIVYILLSITGPRVKAYGLIQTVLYVDGLFILVNSTLSLPIQYAVWRLEARGPERIVDIFETEFERCLSEQSAIYWMIRGDLTFYLYSDKWRPADYFTWILENRDYFVIWPFLLLFAYVMRTKYRGRIPIFVLVGAAAFAVAVELTRFVESEIRQAISVRSDCTTRILAEVPRKYSTAMIVRQLEYKFNNELKRTLNRDSTPTITVKGQDFVWLGKLRSEPEGGVAAYSARLENMFDTYYCQGGHYYWKLVRQINSKLGVLIQHWDNNSIIYAKVFRPDECKERPAT